jgi:hypothetical protein
VTNILPPPPSGGYHGEYIVPGDGPPQHELRLGNLPQLGARMLWPPSFQPKPLSDSLKPLSCSLKPLSASFSTRLSPISALFCFVLSQALLLLSQVLFVSISGPFCFYLRPFLLLSQALFAPISSPFCFYLSVPVLSIRKNTFSPSFCVILKLTLHIFL